MQGGKDTQIQKQTELVNTGDPRKNRSYLRAYYYTTISFELFGINSDIEVKVDTGSPYTVVGAQNRKLDAVLKEHLRTVGIDGRTAVEDASGNPIGLKPQVVQNFKLTDDIVFPKVKIYFSDSLKEKAILGMDILTLFDFKYHRDDKAIWIYYEENFLEKLGKKMINKNLGYIDPGLIAAMDEFPSK